MSEYEPVYRRPDIKFLMSVFIARQGVLEAVEIVFIDGEELEIAKE